MIRITNLSEYICSADLRLYDVVARINHAAFLFQIVLDDDGALIGTITDGDVRRAILARKGADIRACEMMNPKPFCGVAGEEAANISMFRALQSSRPFLPVVDRRGRLVEILAAPVGASGIMEALVMAGGYGKRLGERTKTIPKPLLPVGGRPILDRVIAALEDAGVPSITLSVHYLAEQIVHFISERENRAVIKFVEETSPLGTGGAIGLLEDKELSPLLVLNGDVLTGCDFAALHDFHMRHRLDGTIGVTRYDVDVPYGVVRYDEEGFFSRIEEKPRISNFIAAGVYYLSPEFRALVPSGRPIDMPELLNNGKRLGLRIGLFPIHEYWADVGHPEDLDAADARHSEEEE